MPVSKALGYIGVGNVFFQEINDDGTVSEDMIDAGNVIAFELAAKAGIEKQISRRRDTAGQVLATATQALPSECSIKLESLTSENLRRLWLGSSEEFSRPVEVLTGVTVKLSKKGYRKIQKEISGVLSDIRNIGASVVLTNAGATETYVENQDYLIDRWSGLIAAVPGGAINDADLNTCKITCATEVISGVMIRGATKPTIRVRVSLNAKNTVDNSFGSLTLWECTVKPKSGIDLLADKWAVIEYEMELTTPVGYSEPFQYLQH